MAKQKGSQKNRHKPHVLRHILFRRFGLLLMVAIALVAGCYAYFGVKPVVNNLAESSFFQTSQLIESSLQRVFHPAQHLVQISSYWLAVPDTTLTDSARLNFFFKPILKKFPQISSIVVGNTAGQGYMLLEMSDNRWLNRVTDVTANGALQHFVEWQGDSKNTEYSKNIDYDPRRRPWFLGAMQSNAAGEVFWSDPYPFFTTKDTGITASIRKDNGDRPSVVVGFDIMLRDISAVTSTTKVAQHGFVAVITDDEKILGLPSREDNSTAKSQQLLQPISRLSSQVVNAGVEQWHQGNKAGSKIYHYFVAGEHWLATFVPFPLGNQRLWICMFAPVVDFIPAWQTLAQALLVILALITAATLLAAQRISKSLSEPLEMLASASEAIAKLDFSDRECPVSNVTEVIRLVEAQKRMRGMLDEFQKTVALQQNDLQLRIVSLNATQLQLRESENRLQQALKHVQALFDNALVGIAFMRNRVVVDCNRQLCAMAGYSRREVVGATLENVYISHEAFIATGERIDAAFAQGEDFNEEGFFRNSDNITFWGQISGRLLDKNKPDLGSVWIVADLTQQKQAQQRLEYLSYHDPLTTLPNRLLFHDRLIHAIDRAKRKEKKLAVLFIDLDHFKAINDTLGHDVGDTVLAGAAKTLGNSLRATDTLARSGGDEFMILVEDVDDRQVISVLAEKLLGNFSQPLIIAERSFHLTMSIGISVYPDDGADMAALVRNADAAMYHSKVQGRNTYNFYAETVALEAFERLNMEGELRHIIERGQLEFYLQPQIKLPNAELVGVEALMRWNHPVKGMIPPNVFIPIAEISGIIVNFGNWILEQCCREWVRLHKQGLQPPRIAVNFSAKQLLNQETDQRIMAILRSCDCPASAIEIEITESTFLEEEQAVNMLLKLTELGIHLSLDDFGTGYSSLSYLKKLPFSKLKIDRSFIQDIGTNAEGETLIRTIINLAKTLNMDVIAEGVETEEQSEFLFDAGCEQLQGYLYGKPMPPEKFNAWLIALRENNS